MIASASIDKNNISYRISEFGFSEELYDIITAQSKSILFNDIVKVVEGKIGKETPIKATPIVGSNKMIDESIKSKILPA